jgi:hypothetical protein
VARSIQPPVGCGWSERRSSSDEYVIHLGEVHLATLRNIGFANADILAWLGRAPLRRIHSACIEREELNALRASADYRLLGLGHVVGHGEEEETQGGRGV